MAYSFAYHLFDLYIFYFMGNLSDYLEGIPKEYQLDIPDEVALVVLAVTFVTIFLLGLEFDSDNLRDTVIIIAQAA